MRLEIRIGSRSGRRWHDNLVRRLRALPATDVSVTLIPEARSKERDRLERLLWLERRLHGLDEGMLADPGLSSTPPAGDIEVILDLTADPVPGSWVVLYDGRSGEAAAADALRAGRFPLVSVVDGAGTVRAVGRPGSELPGLLATALADIGVGTATLIAGAVAGSPFASPADADAAGAASRTRGFAELAARRLVGAAIRRVYRMLYRAPHWRVGWRRLDGPDLLALGELPSRWHDLPDDGYRFFADPFPFEHDGRTYLFVEDFDHRVGKAVISVVEWGDDGPRGLPRPVLTHDVHLSYPFVLEHEGEVWMIPETSGARTVELYSAVRFPWEWERHSILLDDVEKNLETVRQLKALGVRLSIDDFGTGYSSLSYLKRFAVDRLKIDRRFVRDIHTEPDDAAIVRAVIQLARSLRLGIIAEGVETEEQLAFLRREGCEQVQGYLYSRPLNVAALRSFMSRHRSTT